MVIPYYYSFVKLHGKTFWEPYNNCNIYLNSEINVIMRCVIKGVHCIFFYFRGYQLQCCVTGREEDRKVVRHRVGRSGTLHEKHLNTHISCWDQNRF